MPRQQRRYVRVSLPLSVAIMSETIQAPITITAEQLLAISPAVQADAAACTVRLGLSLTIIS